MSYDHWKTTEPMDEYPGDGVHCLGCDVLLQKDEYEESGCDKCGAPPPPRDEDEPTTTREEAPKEGEKE